MLVAGILSPLPEWGHAICAKDSSLLPTLSKTNAHGNDYTRDRGQKGKERLTLAGLSKAGLLPTLVRNDAASPKRAANSAFGSRPLREVYPTFCKRDHRSPNSPDGLSRRKRAMKNCGKQLPNMLGQRLTPEFCEWFMGFPAGWSASKPLAMRKFRAWSRQHGGVSSITHEEVTV